MISKRHPRRGFTLLSLLMVFVILAVLGGTYFSTDTPDGKPWVVTTTDRARTAAAAMNFRNAETTFMMRTEGRRLEINQLRQELGNLSQTMGSGGRFFTVDGYSLENTANLQTPKFSQQFPLPRMR